MDSSVRIIVSDVVNGAPELNYWRDFAHAKAGFETARNLPLC
jgi:hypothetical protein